MASRCIKALNDLDDISDKVFYKYSKNRFRSEIEGRIKASKSKVDRSLDQNSPPKAEKRRGSSSSSNSQETSNTATKSRGTKSAANPKISHAQIREQKERAKTSSYCRNRAYKTSLKKNGQTQDEIQEKSKLKTGKTPSVYGKHSQEEEEKSNTDNWFNFDDGVKMGTIDSFVCDERNKKALCYSLDKKKAKPIPKLLRHRLEVRIGQNGDVRNDSGIQETDSTDTGNTNISKKMPLSWEEQLNWENACIKSPRPPAQHKTEDQGLCETHPVVFHPQERPTTVSSSEYDIRDSTAAYRMFLERRLLVSDRGNLMCGGKCITSVEIEDARDEIEEKKKFKMRYSSLKAYALDDDRMDMSTTIRNIENIYPRRSAASKSSSMFNSENVVENTEPVESNQVENPDEVSDRDILQSKDSERTDKINKKVSFKDEIDLNEKYASVGGQSTNIEIVREANVPISPSKERPKSSKERSEVLANVKERPKRPYTAPPCSPRLTRDKNFEKEIARRHFNLAPVRVPTSEAVLSDQDERNETPLADNVDENLTVENDSELKDSRNTNESQPMRVSVACKSAPTLRETQKPEENISRSLSSMSARTNKNKYVPPQPVAVLADSSMELPPNLPPAKALVELRKKIREDLAKETADLQLDIQQLYLKHHASS